MADPGITLDDLRIAINGTPLLHLSAHVAPGQVLSVMGPSGVGKSTLLAAIIGTLDRHITLQGDIRLGGTSLRPLPPERRRIGILYQDHLLFPHMNVAQNLAFGLAPGLPNRKARVAQALQEVGLSGFGPRDPETLSGGQKARVALMRTLLSEPRALLLDEPFSRLDPDRRDQIRHLVFERARAAKLPVLLVTHDPADARAADGPILHLRPHSA